MPNEQEITQLCGQIWEATLGLSVGPSAVDAVPDTSPVCASIAISGAWRGTVVLRCDGDLARQAAAIMFGLEPASTSEADRNDAVGELVNMIGGNVKALLPEPCKLSVPAFSDHEDAGEVLETTVGLTCDDRALQIDIYSRNELAA